jgi:ATP-binding cassette subfamily F protein 3
MLLRPSNTLLLDEPTNHLDIDSKEVLLDALADYGGTLVFVSHDRYFVERLATKIIEVGDGKATLYPGTYEAFLWRKNQPGAPPIGSKGSNGSKGSKGEVPRVPSPKSQVPSPKSQDPSPKSREQSYEERKRASADQRKRERAWKALKDRVAELEKRIAEREKAIKDVEQKMSAALPE